MRSLRTYFLRYWPLCIIVITAFILRILFLEKWLGDWDSIQLALGLNDYSLVKHQPHPPGYPVYIITGKILAFFLQNDTLVLTGMSAFFGTAAVIPIFLLAKKEFGEKMAYFSVLMFIFIPVVWLLSVTALTDIVGLSALILTGYLLYHYQKSKTAVIWVSLLAGFLIGVRFNEFPVVLGLLGWVMLQQKSFKYAFFQSAALAAGGLLWLIPIIMITGWTEFVRTFSENGGYVIAHDVLLGNSHSIPGLIKAKLLMIFELFKLGFSLPLTVVFAGSLLWALLQRKLYSQTWFQFCLIWIFSYSVLLMTFFNLELPRHILPLSVPLLLITVFALKKLTVKNKLFWLVPVLLLLPLIYQSSSKVYRFHNTLPATVAPVLYVKQNFDPRTTVVYASFTLRAFEYYAPEFKSIDKNSEVSVITPDKTVIVDHLDLIKDPALQGFEEVDAEYFSTDKDIFPKVDSIDIHVLKHKSDLQ